MNGKNQKAGPVDRINKIRREQLDAALKALKETFGKSDDDFSLMAELKDDGKAAMRNIVERYKPIEESDIDSKVCRDKNDEIVENGKPNVFVVGGLKYHL